MPRSRNVAELRPKPASLLRMLLAGARSYVRRDAGQSTAAGQPIDPSYGYAVWLRHIVRMWEHGVRGPFASVVEFGPGDSLATGVCAVLCGAERYVALDIARHLSPDDSDAVVDHVSNLFRQRAAIPDDSRYPNLHPRLASYDFPAEALGPRALAALRDPARVVALRHDIRAVALGGNGGSVLQYHCPWTQDNIAPASVDLLFSQAVLQEMPDGGDGSVLRETIRTSARWLRPGGVASHQIDMGMYGLEPWNVHWSWSDLTWRFVRGRRTNFVNRAPISTYLSLFSECGLTPIAVTPVFEAGVHEERLTGRYRALDERDRRTRSAFVIVRRD